MVNGDPLGVDSVSVGVMPEPTARLLMELGLTDLQTRRCMAA